jgi:hypothetical protein
MTKANDGRAYENCIIPARISLTTQSLLTATADVHAALLVTTDLIIYSHISAACAVVVQKSLGVKFLLRSTITGVVDVDR